MGNPGAKRQPSPVPRGRNSASTPFPAQEPNAVARNLEIHLRGLADEILLLASGDGVAIALAENGELRCRASSGIAPPPGARIDARSGVP